MSLFSKKQMGGGLMDAIRCDETSYLIWKWHPEGTVTGKNRRENAIRWGSSIRVKEGSVAVFVYTQDDGTRQDYIEGPYDGTLSTANLPVLSNIVGLAYAGDTPFQAEVYFINLAQLIQIKFGVPYFDVYDPRFLDYGVPTAVRGAINFSITDYREFMKLHRLDAVTMGDFQNQVKNAVIRYVKGVVSNAPEANGIPVVQLERKIETINSLVEESIKARFFEEFGVTVSNVDISAVDVDKTSEGYRQLKAVTQDLMTATMQAKTEVDIKEMRDSQKLGILERAGRALVDIREGGYERHKITQSANLAAYQIEAQEHVGVAGAIGLGKMGAGGGGNVAGGMNPVAMMAGMYVGSAVGQNIAGNMNSVMSGAVVQQQPVAPPPIPATAYHVAVDGKATGPYDIPTLSGMAQAGQFLDTALVWKSGMDTWTKAGEIEELKPLFNNMPPIPTEEELPPIPPEA